MTGATSLSECHDQAAVRHFLDAEHLAADQRWDGAGHLIGFAAECALKHAIRTVVVGGDPPHGHLPAFVEVAKKHLRHRFHKPLYELLGQIGYFNNWSVHGRYAADGSVSESLYAQWRASAVRTLGATGLRSSR